MNSNRWLWVCLASAAVGLFVVAGLQASEVDVNVVHVAMFKNGLGVVVSEAHLPGEGTFRLRPLPQATLGSLWLNWGGGLEITNVKATQVETMQDVAASSIAEILEANIGRTVALRFQKDEQWHKVKIVDVPQRQDGAVIQPRPVNVIPASPPRSRGELLLLEENGGLHAISRNSVTEVRREDGQLQTTVQRIKQENVVELNATGGSGQRRIAFTYMAQGIAWSPSYIVDISAEQHATISAKALLVNDLVPLENAEVELIAGFPHLQFGSVPSPFSLTPLRQVLEQLRRGHGRKEQRLLANTMAQQDRVIRRAGMSGVPSMPTTPVMGEAAEDLYFYQLNDVSLKKGERGYYPMFAGKVPHKHIYTWEIPDYIDANNRYRNDQQQADQIVWHALELTNTTGNPWTTAPATTAKAGRTLGQDTIHYTPSNATTELKITQAVAVDAQENEHEIERKRNAEKFYNTHFDLVTVKGELAITNYKDKPVTLKISKTLSGDVREADGNPKIDKLARGLRQVNSTSQLIWNVDVEPGRDDGRSITYTYQVYVRN